MIYSISSISNRDLQLLYHYRILRQPSDLLNAAYTDSEPIPLTFSEGGLVSEKEYSDELFYSFKAPIQLKENMVPLLEFTGEESDWSNIQDLVCAKFDSDTVTLYSTSKSLGKTTGVNLYWVQSFEVIRQLLEAYSNELASLQEELTNLDTQMTNLDFSNDYLERPKGVVGNLVKFVEREGKLSLGDSEHKITGAVESQNLTNPTIEYLARMVKDVTGDLSISCTDNIERTLQGMTGSGEIIISGTGTWYLIDTSNSITFQKFRGTVYLNQCPAVRTGNRCTFEEINAVNSFLVHNLGTIKKLCLARHAIVKHNSGEIQELLHVGVGCEYYSQTRSKYEPKFEWTHIQGLVCLSNGVIILNGREISFVTGHHDDPLPPSEIKVIKSESSPPTDEDSGTTGDRVPVDGNTPKEKVYNWFINNTDLPKEAIIGIMSNIEKESGYDPFITGSSGSYVSLWQVGGAGGVELTEKFNNEGLGSHLHSLPTWSSWEGNVSESDWDKAIDLSLSYLIDTHYNSDGFSNYAYNECLDKVSSKTGSSGCVSYCELFCAMVERCIGGTDAIQDSVVADFIFNTLYGGTTYLYQNLTGRRDSASNLWSEFGGS